MKQITSVGALAALAIIAWQGSGTGAPDEVSPPTPKKVVFATIAPFNSYGVVHDGDNVEAMRPRVMGTRGVISSGHYLATQAGYDVLRGGGNAFDAGRDRGDGAQGAQDGLRGMDRGRAPHPLQRRRGSGDHAGRGRDLARARYPRPFPRARKVAHQQRADSRGHRRLARHARPLRHPQLQRSRAADSAHRRRGLSPLQDAEVDDRGSDGGDPRLPLQPRLLVPERGRRAASGGLDGERRPGAAHPLHDGRPRSRRLPQAEAARTGSAPHGTPSTRENPRATWTASSASRAGSFATRIWPGTRVVGRNRWARASGATTCTRAAAGARGRASS